MATERPENPRARLFVALDLPESLRDKITEWGGQELSDPALRPVPRESLHVTLAFLGSRPERDIEKLRKIVAEIAAPAPAIQLGDPIAKPSLDSPRLFALPTDSPATVALQGELAGELVAKRLYRPEKRPFWPHVTVARVKGTRRRRRVDRQPGKLPRELLSPIRCVRLTLYRSELQPLGARYAPLAQVELSETGGSEVETWQTRKRL
jgi:2'-5' RNA ligase